MNKILQTILSLFIIGVISVRVNAQTQTHTVSWENPENGKIAVTLFSSEPTTAGELPVSNNSQILVEAAPSEGYYTKSLKANGEDILLSRTVVVKEDVTLTAEFEKIPADNYLVRYPVTYHTNVDVTYNGEKLPSGSIVPANSQIGIRVVPFTGVQISGVTVNGESLSGSTYTVNQNILIAYSLNVPEAGVYVNYEQEVENGYISALRWANGQTITIDPLDRKPVYVSQMVWICGIPKAGYVVDEIMVNGVSQKLEPIDVVNPFFGTIDTYTGAKYPVQYTDINITATFKLDDGSSISKAEKNSSVYNYENHTLSASENVAVFDTTGKKVLTVAEGQEVSFENMSSGLYIIKGENTNLKIVR